MRAVVLLSGGLDSTTALALALSQGRECAALTMFYGQRHVVEVEAAQRIAEEHYRIPWEERAAWIPSGDSVLMQHEAEMPHKPYSEIEGVSPTYVPFRNGIFLATATAIALNGKYDEVWFGAHADDADGWAYPDCTPEFIGAIQNAIFVGTYHKVRLVAPFTYATKADIVRKGLDLDAPYSLTVSCYEGKNVACGECPTCLSRLEAFKANDATDPITYAISYGDMVERDMASGEA